MRFLNHWTEFGRVAGWGALLMLLAVGPAVAGRLELISKADPPADTNGDSGYSVAASADGRYVAFLSYAPNLVAGQFDDLFLARYTTFNIFLRDRVAGTTVLITHVPGSAGATSSSDGVRDILDEGPRDLDISADGRYVVYSAQSTRLVPGQVQTSQSTNVFLYDRVTGTNTLISHPIGQPEVTGDLPSFDPWISADGSYVAFTSRASNLVAGQVGPGANSAGVYLYQRASGKLTLLSHKSGSPSTPANGTSYTPRISADGSFVVFTSVATDLVPAAIGAPLLNVFLYQRSTGAISLISHPNGSPLIPTGGAIPQISSDGRWIAFFNGGVRLQDRLTGMTQLVSHSHVSPATGVDVDDFELSASGNAVIFSSPATDVVAGQVDTNLVDDLFVFDRVAGSTTLVSHAAGSRTTAGKSGTYHGMLSADGRFIAFASEASNLVPHQIDPINPQSFGFDCFLYDRTTGVAALVSHVPASLVTVADRDSFTYGISADGGTVLIGSDADDLNAGEINWDHFLYLFAYDRRSADLTPVSHRDPADPAVTPDGPSSPEAISADGRMVLFSSLATGLVPGQVDVSYRNANVLDLPQPTLDFFLHDRATGKTTLVSRSSASPPTAIGGSAAVLSGDGTTVALVAYDPLVQETPQLSRLYLYDQAADRLSLVNHTPGSTSTYAGHVFGTSLSADGRYLLFGCSRCKVVPGMQDPADVTQSDLFLYDGLTNVFTLVSHALGDPLRPANGGSYGTLSADGRYLLISSRATDLVAGQTGPAGSNLFLLDRTTGVLILVSHVPGAGTMAATGSFSGSGQISADGRWILFTSNATDLVPGQAGGGQDFHLFLYDRTAGTTVLVDHTGSSPLTPAGKESSFGSMSSDGRWIVFSSDATDLIPGGEDANARADVFLYDRDSGTTALITHAAGSPTTADSAGGDTPQISADGSRIVYRNSGTATQIILQDRVTGARTVAGEVYPGPVIPTVLDILPSQRNPLLAANGRQVAFASAEALAVGDLNRSWDAYLYDDSAGGPVPLPPCALFDGSLRSNLQQVLAPAGTCGVPATATRVTVKVTARQATGTGNLRLYPGNVTATPAGTLRFQRGQTASSSFDLPLATNGAGTLAILPLVRGNGTVRVTVEVDGYTP